MKKLLLLSIAMLLCFSVSALAVNGESLTIKSITLDENPDVEAVPRGADDLSKLWDGDVLADATEHQTAGIVLFKNKRCTEAGVHPEYSLTIELDKASTISGIDIAIYHRWISMIGLTKDNEIKVEKSSDGTAFIPVETLKFEGEAANGTAGVIQASLSFKEKFDAKYLKLTFTYADSPFLYDSFGKVIWEWHGLTEIAVVEGEDNPETTPETGDLSQVTIIAAIISALCAIFARKTQRV